MKHSVKPWLMAFALSTSLALSAASASAGDAPASMPVDWGHAMRTGFIAVGLWVAAYLLGRMWIRARSTRAKKSDE